MKISEIITEASKDWNERVRAERELRAMLKGRAWTSFSADEIKQAKKLVSIMGRRYQIYLDRWNTTAGIIFDKMVQGYREGQAGSGQMPEFTGRATTAKDMANQIAIQTGGRYEYKYPRTWTTGYGDRYKDPSDHIRYSDKNAYDDAWAWLESKGKKVYYHDNAKVLNTAIQIGRYIAEPASITRGPFSDNPQTEYLISIRTAKVINQAVRTQADLTDQQAAALKDIAATKNASSMNLIKSLLAVMQGQQDVKQVIAKSQKLDPRDKAKLDSIIAGAQNFKEPE